MLSAHKEQLDRLAAKLLEKEVIFKDDLIEVLGPRPWEEEIKPVEIEKTVEEGLPKATPESSNEVSVDNDEIKPVDPIAESPASSNE